MRDCTDPATLQGHLDEAAARLAAGDLVVFPTDTVYGLGADAFTPTAVAALLAAKGRTRDKPPPVLIADTMTMAALATDVSPEATALAEAFWPGPLTLILTAQPSLMWDLGDTLGTVALRVPDEPLALDLLRRTGPLAVSSANRTGGAAAVTCAQALEQLADAVALYLDGGPTAGPTPSTIVDCTLEVPTVRRLGALSLERLREVVETVALPPTDGTSAE